MNPENFLVEAWLKAGVQSSEEIGCTGGDMLLALVSRQLPEPEARRMTLHLAGCASCRRAVAQLVSGHAAPTEAAISLAELLSTAGVTDAWRGWIRGLVRITPTAEDETGRSAIPGYDELAPPRIDDQDRLIVDLAPSAAAPHAGRIRVSLTGDGARLDLCEVTALRERLYAVVDLSAFDPRPGILRSGVLTLEPVTLSSGASAVLPQLAALQDEGVTGTEFWDRFAPIAAHGERLAALLAEEIAASEGDRTTRAPRLRAGAGASATAVTDKTPTGRVQYALNALEEFAALWKECNGKDLEGAAFCAVQLRSSVSPARPHDPEETEMPDPRLSASDKSAKAAAARIRRE